MITFKVLKKHFPSIPLYRVYPDLVSILQFRDSKARAKLQVSEQIIWKYKYMSILWSKMEAVGFTVLQALQRVELNV